LPAFFDDYPRFYETSQTTPGVKRLEHRHRLIIRRNLDLFKDRSVVEIAAHDGRWAFAALKAGAKSVYGVEPRQHLVDNANATFEHYGIPKDQYEFVARDGYAEAEDLVRAGRTFDTAMILGFLYHTGRPYEIILRMAALQCSAIIVDTSVLPGITEPYIKLALEPTKHESWLWAEGKSVELGGKPSALAVRFMLKAAGYEPFLVPGSRKAPKNAGCKDYLDGNRFTFIGLRGDALRAANPAAATAAA